MEQLLSLAKERVLTLAHVGLLGADSEEVKRFCDEFARRLVAHYLAEELTWEVADAVANHYFLLMTQHCGPVMPKYAWDVYLAFDEGEIDDRRDSFTRPRLLALQQEYGYA